MTSEPGERTARAFGHAFRALTRRTNVALLIEMHPALTWDEQQALNERLDRLG